MRSFGKAQGGGRRTAARIEVPVLAVISSVTRDRQVAIVDVSRSGVRVTAESLPGEGEAVIFRMGKVEAFGIVVWALDDECGITFETSILSSDVNQIRSDAALVGVPGLCAAVPAAEWPTRVE